MTGEQVADNVASSLVQANVSIWLLQPVRRVQPRGDGMAVTLGTGDTTLYARYLVLATGVRARPLSGSEPDLPDSGVLTGRAGTSWNGVSIILGWGGWAGATKIGRASRRERVG